MEILSELVMCMSILRLSSLNLNPCSNGRYSQSSAKNDRILNGEGA